jgi:hypothetical protein
MLSFGPTPGVPSDRQFWILDSALDRPQVDDDPVEQIDVLVYRAELALMLHDPETAAEMLARARSSCSPTTKLKGGTRVR